MSEAHESQHSNGGRAFGPLRLARRPDGVALAWMDVPGEKVNTLKSDFGPALTGLLDAAGKDNSIQALVLCSAKPDSFVAGADISMLGEVRSVEEGATLSRQAQAFMDSLAASAKPVVAAIHGSCLGGGLELALACHGRVASKHRKTKLGLPEVQLGILPGAGGTQRLPQLVELATAIDMMLTGRQISAKKAVKLGLVDEVVPAAILVEVACTHALKLAAGRRKNGRDGSRAPQDTWLPQLKALSSRAPAQLQQWALSGNPVGRHVFFDQAKKRLLAKSHGLYPAPERILQVVRHGLEQGFAAGLAAEAQAFGELLQTPESAALMGIFHGQQALKKASGTDDPTAQPRPLERVAVLGAGLMGAGIAYVSAAQAGLEVRLRDMKDDALLRGMGQIRGILEGRKRRGRLQGPELERIMAHIGPSTDVQHIAHADIVIEAVFEDLELKRKVLREVEACTRPDTIFASNTSALPISDIAAASAHPETVIGMHYFSPVEKMPLLEVITTEHTAPWVTATAVQLGKKQGKTVIVVRDGVGFYTTRIVMPFMNEAAYLLAEGVPVEEIDAALTAFGFPVGPLKLTDEVGIDVGQKVSHIMHEAFGERAKPAPLLQRLIDDKRFGRKNGRGFYRYEAGARGVDESIYTLLDQAPQPGRIRAEQIAERCVLQMVNEALRCLHEGILRQVQDGDIGAVFGLGFPPYLGGPLRYVDSRGVATILRRLETLEASHGPRFQPAPLLRELAQQGLRLYPATGAMPSHNPHSPAQGALRA